MLERHSGRGKRTRKEGSRKEKSASYQWHQIYFSHWRSCHMETLWWQLSWLKLVLMATRSEEWRQWYHPILKSVALPDISRGPAPEKSWLHAKHKMEIPGKVPKCNWLCLLQFWLYPHSPQAEGSFSWRNETKYCPLPFIWHKKFKQCFLLMSDRTLFNSQSLTSLHIPLQEGTTKGKKSTRHTKKIQ